GTPGTSRLRHPREVRDEQRLRQVVPQALRQRVAVQPARNLDGPGLALAADAKATLPGCRVHAVDALRPDARDCAQRAVAVALAQDRDGSAHRLRALDDRERMLSSALVPGPPLAQQRVRGDRKSTRLNSSHVKMSYAVFCVAEED